MYKLHLSRASFFLSLLSILLFASSSLAATKPDAHAIASAHPLATNAGHEILAAGGNAFDAAIAVTAALAVVEPAGSGLGGGGFFLLHRAQDQFEVMIDAREKAPLAAHKDMYLDKNGDVIKGASWNGPLAAGIPGIPAALVHLAKKYGKLPLRLSLGPAIRYARNGFTISDSYRNKAKWRLKIFQSYPETAAIFLDEGELPKVGFLLKQNDLASTLQALTKGKDGFYSGEIAQKLVSGARTAGGIWTLEDLAQYQIVEREPITFNYKQARIVSAAPPSSGGVALATMLNILDDYDLDKIDTASRTHIIVEAMRRAYRDRSVYLGDPDFVNIPVERLINQNYAAGLRASIRMDQATASETLPGSQLNSTGTDTTHFSIIDTDGNRVAATLSINLPFGAAFAPPGTGVLLNDEMDDFSMKPGVPNAYGLIGNAANAIAPGKRPLSSMSPTFIETEDRVAVLGTPGGSRIITMVLHGILEFIEGESVNSWVNKKRFHHQYLPDVIQHEKDTFDKETMIKINKLGHILQEKLRPYGNMQAILWNKKTGQITAASDARGIGKATVK
ncbi:Gamma-glutamyltranspeptidase @ Glutathione hydrolase [hydrothermal vent metagenome]|uniref:Gamma-glutamyltranspeptidase @ Glutathione hydrolase n=1 Tax=hydrothermal vent metagenome TaxID=652676 RepID=A0A3B0YSV2_9ZZZZ